MTKQELVAMTIRLPKDLHLKLKISAVKKGVTLQDYVAKLIMHCLESENNNSQQNKGH